MSRDLRKELRAECAACARDANRDPAKLRELLDEHAVMPNFGLVDGFLENVAIRISMRYWRRHEKAA